MSTAIVISVIAILLITLIIARSGAAVVYYDGGDLGVTLCTWLVWIAYFFIRMFFISTYDGELVSYIPRYLSMSCVLTLSLHR